LKLICFETASVLGSKRKSESFVRRAVVVLSGNVAEGRPLHSWF
jgi:hypothetical protein